MSFWHRFWRWWYRGSHPDSHERELRSAETRLQALEDHVSVREWWTKDHPR